MADNETNGLSQKIKQLESIQNALLEIAEQANQVRDQKAFYHYLHGIMNKLMYADNLYIALLSTDKQFVTFEYFQDNEEEDDFDPTSWPPEPIESFKLTLTGHLFRTGKSLLANSQQLEDLISQGMIKLRGKIPHHWLGVPLKVRNETMGVLVVQSYSKDITYTEQDEEVAIFISQQIASVLNQKRYEKQLKEYNEQLEQKVVKRTAMLQKINTDLEKEILERERSQKLQAALFRISELTNTARDIDEFYFKVHKIINGIMPSRNFYICTFDKKKKEIAFPYVIDEFDSQKDSRSLNLTKNIDDHSPTERVLLSGQSLLINKKNRDEWIKRNVINGTPPETWLGVPLLENGVTTGVLTVQSYLKGKSYTKLDEEILQFVAQQVATALHRKKNSDDLMRAHADLKRSNDELEQRVNDRTKELLITNDTLKNMLEERNKMQKKLAYEAFHDSLTGLPNRALFINRLQQILQEMTRNTSICFSILYLDLDRFKVINDSLGHLMGDALLQEVAQRLEICVRPEDTVARLGGDEFCILLRNIDDERDAAIISDRILESISKPFMLQDQMIYTSTSIGVTLSKSDYKNPNDVLRDADAAMYHAKEAGKARYMLFDKQMHDRALMRLKLENELRHALQRNQIKVHYQPLVDIRTSRIIGFEALARWYHDELGMISPVEFIPIAEETGLIHDIGLFILHHSLATLKFWHSQFEATKDISMSVNFSSKQIEHHDLFREIESALEENQLTSKSLKVEITESILIENADLAQSLISSLTEKKIPVLLDDFGTGYSSLSYLHKFSLDTIKIDRSFIYLMDQSEKHHTIVKTIAYMCSNLNLNVIAEGVETQTHVDMLNALGIHSAQGFHYSKPVSAEEALKLVIKFNSPQ